MGLLKKLKKMRRGTEYRINREILIKYVNENIALSSDKNLSFVDEFYLRTDDGKEEIHITIINYDVPCDDELVSENLLHGIVIFANAGGFYNPEQDEKYYGMQDLVNVKLAEFPEIFILRNDLGEPVSLERYKVG